MKIEWVRKTERSAHGSKAMVGKWGVGSVDYGCVTGPNGEIYEVRCSLPGIKDYLGKFISEQEGKERLESAINHWFNEAAK